MKVRVDSAKCQGHARCNAIAPRVFDLDEDGYSVVRSETVSPELEEDARRGADSCPEQAIVIEE